jgi:hypothetical protein
MHGSSEPTTLHSTRVLQSSVGGHWSHHGESGEMCACTTQYDMYSELCRLTVSEPLSAPRLSDGLQLGIQRS